MRLQATLDKKALDTQTLVLEAVLMHATYLDCQPLRVPCQPKLSFRMIHLRERIPQKIRKLNSVRNLLGQQILLCRVSRGNLYEQQRTGTIETPAEKGP